MIPFAVPATLTRSQERAVRSCREAAHDALRAWGADDDRGSRPRAEWARTWFAALTAILAQGRCVDCLDAPAAQDGAILALYGVRLGRCCDECSADLRTTRGGLRP